MAKKMLIDATHAEETRVVVVDGTKVEEFDFETLNKRQLAGNIYLAKITRVEPSLQAAFVDYGGNRHGFLAFAEIHPDYYQIPAADRKALIEEERVAAEAAEAEENARERRGGRRDRRSDRPADRPRAEAAGAADAVTRSDEVPGMEVRSVDEEELADDKIAQPVENDAAATGFDSGAEGTESPAEAAAPRPASDAEDDSAQRDATVHDDEIESVAEEDMAEEIRPAKKPRARRYKIQEVIRVRQIMLVQVVKEERGNKGAALTTYLSLAGRYCVLMPNTARGGGISRKITNAADRKKLKEIAGELEVPQGAGLIIRTAGSQRTKVEIRRDYEYLMRLWEQIRELTFRSMAPAPIYEEGDLIKRTIRDLYSKEIDEVLVEGERGYRTAKDFMKMIMPSHAKNVKPYGDPMPLFARYQVEGYLGGMFNPVVQLKSGGYIVIGVTEALVAIDVNSGRATKEGSIEETAFKTNCEAADEIARQLRLRDLAGLIVIDFIDMDERKNNAAVEKRFKDRLKTDRARIQVGRISGFGLMEMSRQRLRPGMLESTTQPCPHCHGTGLIRSDDSMALTILRAIEEEGTRKRSREVLVRAPVAVTNFLMNHKREHVGMIEARYGMAVRVEADPSLISPDYALEKFKTATRNVPEAHSQALSVDATLMAQIDGEDDLVEDDEAEEIATEVVVENARRDASAEAQGEASAEDEGDDAGRSRRRRRRRRRGGRGENGDDTDAAQSAQTEASDEPAEEQGEAQAVEPATETAPAEERPRSRSRTRSRRPRGAKAVTEADAETVEAAASEGVAEDLSDQSRDVPAGQGVAVVDGAAADAGSSADELAPAALVEPVADIEPPVDAAATPAEDLVAAIDSAVAPLQAPENPVEAVVGGEVELSDPAAESQPAGDVEPLQAPAEEPAARPRRRGWWSFGG